MRLAHFIHRYPPALGGAESYFARLSLHGVAQGDTIEVFTSNALSLEAFWSGRGICVPAGDEREGDVTIHRFPLLRFPGRRYVLKAMSLLPHRQWQCLTLPCNPIAPAMWTSVTQKGVCFDAVHATAFPYAFPIVCARRLARRLDVPFFITPFLHLGNPEDSHDRTRRSYTSPALTWLLREADGVFVQTPSERDAALALGLPRENVILQGLGVEPAECTGGDRFTARERWRLPPDAVVVGHLANHSWEKGTNDLLAALELLWRKDHPIYLLLAGPEMPNFVRYFEALKKRCPEMAGKWVRQLGAITDAVKRDFFAAIDVFALPSRSDSFGLVLLEAWANGVPNVAYRAGGVADLIRNGRDGLLVPCGDIEHLSSAIRRLCEDFQLREQLGKEGRSRLSRDFAWNDKLELVRRTILERIERMKKPGPIRLQERCLPCNQHVDPGI